MLTLRDLYLSCSSISHGELLTQRFTQRRWRQWPGNDKSRKKHRRNSHQRSGERPPRSTFSDRTSSARSKRPRKRLQRNRATNNFHSTDTINSIRTRARLQRMGTNRLTLARSPVQRKAAKVDSVKHPMWSIVTVGRLSGLLRFVYLINHENKERKCCHAVVWSSKLINPRFSPAHLRVRLVVASWCLSKVGVTKCSFLYVLVYFVQCGVQRNLTHSLTNQRASIPVIN